MATQEVVKTEAALAAERTFCGEIDVEGMFNVSIAGTWAGTLTAQRKFVSDDASEITGEATATTADKVVDTAQTFSASNIKLGISWIHNTTDDTWAKITAIDSGTQLTIDGDIMESGEAYTIERWWDLDESGVFTANADAVGEEIEGGVVYRMGFLDTAYTSGTAYVRISN